MYKTKFANISSIETLGLNDGPGIRTVIFFQGCKLRCKYCHNPETWDLNGGEKFSAKELFNLVIRYKKYFDVSGGGVTCSGGEPLLQIDFLIEFFKICKEKGIHTSLDTSGYYGENIEKEKVIKLLKYTDLIILDIKHICETGFYNVTGGKIHIFNNFFHIIKSSNVKLWLRHVVMKDLTDDKEHINRVQNFMNQINNVEKIEFLPYHSMGNEKYNCLKGQVK